MRLMSQRTVLVRSCHRLSLLHFLWPPFPTTVQQVVQLQNAPALFCTLQVLPKIYFKLTYTQSPHYAVSFSAVSTCAVFGLCTRQWVNSVLVESLVCTVPLTQFLRNQNMHNEGDRCITLFLLAQGRISPYMSVT